MYSNDVIRVGRLGIINNNCTYMKPQLLKILQQYLKVIEENQPL